jgi:hypothetical protein
VPAAQLAIASSLITLRRESALGDESIMVKVYQVCRARAAVGAVDYRGNVICAASTFCFSTQR